MTTHRVSSTAWGVKVLLAGVTLGLASYGSAASDDVATLDPVFVEASTHAPWYRISLPGYEVISRCPNDFNETYALALQTAQAARLAVLPAPFWGTLATPMKIVLYDRPPEATDGILSRNPIDLVWSPRGGAFVGSDSVRMTHPATVGDGDTYISCGNFWNLDTGIADFCVDPDSEILLKNRVPALPAWFVSGMGGPCGIYANRLVKSDPPGSVIEIPNALWSTLGETVAIQEAVAKRKRDGTALPPIELIPIRDLFSGRGRADREHLWNAESALLVRWGLFKSPNRKGFLDFVERASREPVTEKLFQDNVGLDYAAMEAALRAYLPAAVTEQVTKPLAAARAAKVQIRDATQTDVARIIGDWGRMEATVAGPRYIEYRDECLEQADRLFAKAAGSTSNPELLGSLGLYEIQAGDDTRAATVLEQAAKAGITRPRVYLELARLRLRAALPAIPRGIGDLDQAEFDGIVALLATAREQMPALLPCYEVLAQAYEHAPAVPARADLGGLDEGLRLFPRDTALAYKVATLFRTFGYADAAESVISKARAFAETDKDRELLATWRPPQG